MSYTPDISLDIAATDITLANNNLHWLYAVVTVVVDPETEEETKTASVEASELHIDPLQYWESDGLIYYKIGHVTPVVNGVRTAHVIWGNEKKHPPVTIGTPANGLSIDANQVISMAIADATKIGALSAADWITFNSKQAALNGTGLVRMNGTTVSYDNSSYALDSHKHYQLHQPDGTNPFVYTDNSGQLHIDGNIIQSGSAYITHAEHVYTTKDYIVLREGATAGLAAGAYVGLKALKYDGVNDGQLVFDNAGIARVGDVGSEQPLATRTESPTDTYLAIWDSANLRLNFISQTTFAPASGSGNYIWNGTTPQTGNFNISGNGLLGGSIQATTAKLTNNDAGLISKNLILKNSASGYSGGVQGSSILFIGDEEFSEILPSASIQAITNTQGLSNGASDLAFLTYNNAGATTEKMRITYNGNIGIGYSTGTEITNNKLAVNGSGYFNGTVNTKGYLLNGNNLHSSLRSGYLPSWTGLVFENSRLQSYNNGVRFDGQFAVSWGYYIDAFNQSGLNFKSGNSSSENILFDDNGNIKISNLASTNPRLLSSSSTGQLTPITDGTNGQVLTTNGSGGYSFATPLQLGTSGTTAAYGNHNHSGTYDNYQQWYFRGNQTGSYTQVNSSDYVDFKQGEGILQTQTGDSSSMVLNTKLFLGGLTTIINPTTSNYVAMTDGTNNFKVTVAILATLMGSSSKWTDDSYGIYRNGNVGIAGVNQIGYQLTVNGRQRLIYTGGGSAYSMYITSNGSLASIYSENSNANGAGIAAYANETDGIGAIIEGGKSDLRLSLNNSAPTSATASGTKGEIRVTANYIHVCVDTNTWKRAAITTF